jgi:ATP-dependent protease ClpP protease subunit
MPVAYLRGLGFIRETGRPRDAVLSATARDSFFAAQQAKAFGLVDEIIADWGELRHVG